MQQDVIIIGGSFAGLSAAMQLVRGQRKVTVVDAGKPRNRFAKYSHGFFGLDGQAPKAIKQKTWQQLLEYDTATIIDAEAINVEKTGDGFTIQLSNQSQLSAKKLILATGLQDILPDIKGIKSRWGETVVHCPYCHGYELRNRSLGVIATGPMSLHQAGMIPDWGVTTYFSQGEHFPDTEQKIFLQQRGVRFEDTPVIEVLGEGTDISAVKLADGRVIEVKGLYVGPKTQMASSIPKQLGCEFTQGPMGEIVITDDFKQTSIKGVFAAGDIVNPMQNATFASASGVMAGVGVHHQLIQELL
ncbi:NAD(P)/FAD-dependent oxidoreductase [Colwellia sp. 1_MG-2023]|uniref:NAD(P)/FAD-dependent oxidoreductase n=1 Tax=unclassified Colwellia TaxID=196834 RepID=UPI001C082AD5|nr:MULTISPECIES: NAD(P)/FAD-dependent oxidoreductase [unclassified Colwellia]MBU2923343.1 NAD(P)/FAD-dependent oxidoreductase [Colwellia sp. C2M11]MDO6653670.1 NAD(P)/FAD-dependent oxidoreductase [Colwellia sp. 3_MG-2023]MDO6666481.1 NAD(P)/FAD-dependent oxidoreductase [Colwellia sp. 2_MG-2023]MDO6690884.1 NAD(P)/FAD-dependent oxidoreductase [Colwellia sp. 1_MG-2023]